MDINKREHARDQHPEEMPSGLDLPICEIPANMVLSMVLLISSAPNAVIQKVVIVVLEPKMREEAISFSFKVPVMYPKVCMRCGVRDAGREVLPNVVRGDGVWLRLGGGGW